MRGKFRFTFHLANRGFCFQNLLAVDMKWQRRRGGDASVHWFLVRSLCILWSIAFFIYYLEQVWKSNIHYISDAIILMALFLNSVVIVISVNDLKYEIYVAFWAGFHKWALRESWGDAESIWTSALERGHQELENGTNQWFLALLVMELGLFLSWTLYYLLSWRSLSNFPCFYVARA